MIHVATQSWRATIVSDDKGQGGAIQSDGARQTVVADDTRLGGASHGGGDGQDVVVNDNVMMTLYDG